MPTKPSLGVIFHPTYPPEMLVDFAHQAEAGGLDEIWLWEDCFYAGALTSAATLLAATQRIRVGIGLLPAVVRNPLFAAMEIATLARLYPGRFLPGFGHGLESWMKQIGAYPKSSLRAVEETVEAVRGLLRGELVTLQGEHVHLDGVQLKHLPGEVPPLFVGGMRAKTLRLAGRVGDGTILTSLSSPAYVRWAGEQIAAGMAETGRSANQKVVFMLCKVDSDGPAARAQARRGLAGLIGWGGPQLAVLGIEDEARRLVQEHGEPRAAELIPDAWLDELCAAGTPEQVANHIGRLAAAGADSVVLEPFAGDPAALQAALRFLLPALK